LACAGVDATVVARARITSLLTFTACICATAAVGVGGAGGTLPLAAAASTCPNANLTPQTGNVEQVRAAVVCLINQERERHGLSPLQPNAKLARAAQGHSRDMSERDYFSHVAPDGETPLDRMRASGYLANPQAGYVVGENIAWGTLWLATPQAIVTAWMESPGHRANILDSSYRETGVGVSPRPPASLAEGQAGAIYTQDFGAIVAGHASRRNASDSPADRTAGPGGGPQRRHRTHHRRRRHRRHRRHRHHARRRHRRHRTRRRHPRAKSLR
jgi:uncharacterized protein YkwD